MLNSFSKKTVALKTRLPKFLVPRRKYEVDESMLIVKIGRARLLPAVNSVRRPLAPAERELVAFGHHVSAAVGVELRRIVLLIQWGRIPKPWELSFVSKMKEAESQGIPFPEVLQTDLPKVLGEGPSEVLLRWVGRKARS